MALSIFSHTFLPSKSLISQNFLGFSSYVNNFRMGDVAAKLCTDLESSILQLAKDVSSFSVMLSYNKLQELTIFQNCQNCMGWMLVRGTNKPITFDCMRPQKSHRSRWKAGSLGIPNLCTVLL